MKAIHEKEESSVRLLTIEVSEDEVAVLTGSLNHFLAHSDDETVDRVCGAYRDEVEGIRDDLAQLLNVTFRVLPKFQLAAAA
ncbi:MAG: hypothetical protein ACPGWR_26230 [Ardenticatenaceae bacterium]